MFECSVTEEALFASLTVKGRIDALSCPEIQSLLDRLILEGRRTLLVDLTGVNYVSSAGLRLLLATQKQLKNVGGGVVLLGLAGPVQEVFRVSGFDKIFSVVSTRDEFLLSLQTKAGKSERTSLDIGEMTLRYVKNDAARGSFFVVGTEGKLSFSEYTEKDIVAVNPADMSFGCGLGALGETYEEYRDLFGETVVIGGNFFFHPAVKHPAVDFMMDSERDPGLTYKFFHGFGFTGSYQYLLSFDSREGSIELSALIHGLFAVAPSNFLGIVILAESRGLWGMRLRRVPVVEQKPQNGKRIFDPENFPAWFDFPVEAADVNHVVAAAGIAVRDRNLVSPEIQALIADGSTFHVHAGVFEKGPIGKEPGSFEKEVIRILSELKVYKVEHLLGRSRVESGLVGVVEL